MEHEAMTKCISPELCVNGEVAAGISLPTHILPFLNLVVLVNQQASRQPRVHMPVSKKRACNNSIKEAHFSPGQSSFNSRPATSIIGYDSNADCSISSNAGPVALYMALCLISLTINHTGPEHNRDALVRVRCSKRWPFAPYH
eukprot:1161158-Pelagomonas_calceolata.AAC.1